MRTSNANRKISKKTRKESKEKMPQVYFNICDIIINSLNMLADKTNTYQKKVVKNTSIQQLDLKYVTQTYEKTQSLNIDTGVRDFVSEESEVEKLSQVYADKYYYEMKFEQYQNLLTQQQGTITKLISEKKDLLQRLESIKSNEKEVSLLQQLEIKFIESQKEKQLLQIENQQLKNQIQELIDGNVELQQQIETMNKQATDYSFKQQQLIEKLTDDLNSQSCFQEIQKQMHSINQSNNQLFEQLNTQEQVFQTALLEMQEKFSIQQEELTQQYESQLEQKEEELHQMKLDYEKLKSDLYNENQQLQNQVDQLNEKQIITYTQLQRGYISLSKYVNIISCRIQNSYTKFRKLTLCPGYEIKGKNILQRQYIQFQIDIELHQVQTMIINDYQQRRIQQRGKITRGSIGTTSRLTSTKFRLRRCQPIRLLPLSSSNGQSRNSQASLLHMPRQICFGTLLEREL
ncbi:hypothetical protein FGO68_gene14866 [Halteria grandinella]|uniref:Uncharacterized protein n=1 Tax=Halteria grandinella TaxID=5974 RepID=A0A8J8SWZ3_HALGN|nr:hypothetical protein FGO68_gene14866 [Halteria grandinella]